MSFKTNRKVTAHLSFSTDDLKYKIPYIHTHNVSDDDIGIGFKIFKIRWIGFEFGFKYSWRKA
jgi:hypothetical protein